MISPVLPKQSLRSLSSNYYLGQAMEKRRNLTELAISLRVGTRNSFTNHGVIKYAKLPRKHAFTSAIRDMRRNRVGRYALTALEASLARVIALGLTLIARTSRLQRMPNHASNTARARPVATFTDWTKMAMVKLVNGLRSRLGATVIELPL